MTTTNGWVAVLASMTVSAVTNAAMMLENNSSLTPLIQHYSSDNATLI
jgi:hypothetical protein